MKTQLIYDLPTRFFHWIFAGSFIAAFAIGKTVEDESQLFSLHMLAGLLMVFTVILRFFWGVFGSKHSRFTSFALHPQYLKTYLKDVLSGNQKRWPGHNPASSWAAIAMFVLAIGLGITGFLMVNGFREVLEDFHELLSSAFLIIVLLHIAGVLTHSLRHRDAIAFSMLNGRKENFSDEEALTNSRPFIAFVFITVTILFGGFLWRSYDLESQTIKIFQLEYRLGENANFNPELLHDKD